jgi:hypothetical protein
VITYAGKVFYAASADEYDAVFLEVMTFSGNVGDDLLAVRKTDPSYFPQSGVWLFGSLCFDLEAYAAPLRALLQGGGLAPFYLVGPAAFNELIVSRHECRSPSK